MFAFLPPAIQSELTALAQQYGQPLVRSVDLGQSRHFDPLNKKDRYGEVCMVIRRPDGRLITMTKTFYPYNAYRLLTGGINHGELVFDALLRETQEETGLQVTVSRFLVAVAYHVTGIEEPIFYTFAFLLDELGGTLGAVDVDERVEAYLEVMPEELFELAKRLENVPPGATKEINGDWRDWGKFRSVIHKLVGEALQTKDV